MNRFVKKNTLLIGILSVSALIALGLLIYAVIIVVDVNRYLERTENARDTIKKLVKQKPAPGLENEERIQHDIVLYQKAAQGLQDRFKSPLQPAVDAFLNALPTPKLTEEEIEIYKVPGTGEKDEEGKVTKPLQIRKFTADDLKKLIKSRFDLYTADMNDESKNLIDTQTSFIEDFSRMFSSSKNSAASWNKALAIFAAQAKSLTLEPIDSSNQSALLLNALGFPRLVNADPTAFMTHMNEFHDALNTAAGTMELSSQATDFLVATENANTTTQLAPTEYAKVLFHWDVFGDIVKRLSAAKVRQVQRIYVRKYAADEGEKNLQTLGTLHEQVGSYKIYHYTIEVNGSMESFRNAVKAFDEAYKNNRTYIVRAIYLYSTSDAAAPMMGRNLLAKPQQADTPQEPIDDMRMMRRRRRGRVPNVSSMRVEESAEEKRKKEEEAKIKAAEAKLPINERSGYGTILIGGQEDYQAFIDIDYVVLEQEQQ